MRTKMLIFLPIVFLVTGTIFVSSYFVFRNKKNVQHPNKLLTLDDLPKEAIFIRHPEDEEIASQTGGIAMRHYATLEDAKTGGPIYGTMGYRIVSIEYEITEELVKKRPIGQDFAGWKLTIEKMKHAHYDHFHIGIINAHHPYFHSDYDKGPRNNVGENIYLIHFMLISHEEEKAYGLVCG